MIRRTAVWETSVSRHYGASPATPQTSLQYSTEAYSRGPHCAEGHEPFGQPMEIFPIWHMTGLSVTFEFAVGHIIINKGHNILWPFCVCSGGVYSWNVKCQMGIFVLLVSHQESSCPCVCVSPGVIMPMCVCVSGEFTGYFNFF